MNARNQSESQPTKERFVGWVRFLTFLVVLMVTPMTAIQVCKHWDPVDANSVVYAFVSFASFLWPRLLISGAVGTIFLAIILLTKQRPPWPMSD